MFDFLMINFHKTQYYEQRQQTIITFKQIHKLYFNFTCNFFNHLYISSISLSLLTILQKYQYKNKSLEIINLMDPKHEGQNLSIITCLTSPTHIVLTKNIEKSTKDQNNKMLVINRNDRKITQQINFNISKLVKRNFSAFLGISVLEQEYFAVFCDEVKPACTVNKFTTFQIQSLFFLSFNDEKIIKRSEKRQEIYRKIRDLNTLLTTGFYFSHEYNLTRTLQYQKYEFIQHFVWNIVFLRPLSGFPDWQTPVIQGYVSQFQIFLQGTKIFYILISRRSLKKGGTRYFDRGVNDEGDVANYVQNEQIVKINEYLMSDLQIRGNVPLFFEQKGLTTKIKLTRGYQLTHQTYEKHVGKLIKYYQRIFWVNLLSETKKGQLIIIKDLQRHIKQDNNKNVKYYFYDFHKVTDHKNFEKVDEGLEKVQNIKRNLKFYMYDSKKDEVIMRQWGVFRTNCLDCLDRTNFFQTKLAIITFQDILSCFQINFDQPMLKSMNDPNQQSSQIVNFRKIWADNGDAISYHYTGTGSTHTDVIRDGRRGMFGIFKHKYKTVSRFYNQNFWDFYKMKLIDELLNQKTSEVENIMIPRLVKQRQGEYLQRSTLDIYLFSWKATKKIPTSLPLLPNSHNIIAINIQQISEEQKWKSIISQSIDQYKYMLVSQKISNRNLLMVYSKIELKQAISNVQITKVKFKSFYNQFLSTKCAVLVRFLIYNTSFTFIGCQLEFGRQFDSYRIENLKDIHRYAFREIAVGQKQSESILEDDTIFLFGNMNTNISPTYKDSLVQNFSKKKEDLNLSQRRLVTQMLETDQFQKIQQSLLQYRYYEQAEIQFAPTYKYLKAKQAYDSEVSGWPDRIWFSTQKKIVCRKYGVVEELRDQHVPVFANFTVQVQKINEQLQQEVSQEIFSRISQTRGLLNDSNSDPSKSQDSMNKIQ